MYKDIGNDYINNAVNELVDGLGIKEHAPRKELIKRVRFGEIKESIKALASYLGLPIEINLSYVPKKYVPVTGASEKHNPNIGDRFVIKSGIRGTSYLLSRTELDI